MSGGTRSYEISRRLVSLGHEVHMITSSRDLNDSFITKEKGVYVYWIPNFYSNKLSFKGRIFSFLKFSYLSTKLAFTIPSFDVIYATSTPLTIAIPGLILSYIRKRPLIFEVRDLWPKVPIDLGVLKNPILIVLSRWLEKLVYKKSTNIIALAPGMKKEIVSLGTRNQKVSVISNGCDFDLIQKLKKSDPKYKIRNRYNWLGKRKLILYAGAIGQANGLLYVADIAKSMLEIDPEVRFVIIGDGKEKDALMLKSKALNVLNVNLFIFPSLKKIEVFFWILNSDLNLCLFNGPKSLWENAVQNKFFDSIAFGKPVACNFYGFQSKIAKNNNFGILLSNKDALKDALLLKNKLSDRRWLLNASINSKKIAEKYFNYDFLALKLEKILIDAVSQK